MRTLRFCILLMAAACSSENSSAVQCLDFALEREVFVLESDWRQASALGRIDKNGCFTEVADVALGSDPTLSIAGSRVFINVRDQGLIYEVGELGPDSLSIKGPYLASARSEKEANPQDVDASSTGDLWVARYNQSSLLVLDADGNESARIDLSAEDTDRNPEPSDIRIVGEKAYVTLLRLHDNKPNKLGRIAVIDVNTRTVLGTIDLNGQNPIGRMRPHGRDGTGLFVLPTTGAWDAIEPTGGVNSVNLGTKTADLILDENTLGGSAFEVDLPADEEGYALVADTSTENATRLVQFDAAHGTLTKTLAESRTSSSGGFYHRGLAVTDDYVFLGDATPGLARILVFKRPLGECVGEYKATRYPPIGLATFDR